MECVKPDEETERCNPADTSHSQTTLCVFAVAKLKTSIDRALYTVPHFRFISTRTFLHWEI
jgi:hypothetical protein